MVGGERCRIGCGRSTQKAIARGHEVFAAQSEHAQVRDHRSGRYGSGGMEEKPERERPVALTCPSCGGTVAQTTEGGLPSFICHLGHSFAADEMSEAQFDEKRRV